MTARIPTSPESVLAAAGVTLEAIVSPARSQEIDRAIEQARRRDAASRAWVPDVLLDSYEAGTLAGPVDEIRKASIRAKLIIVHGPNDTGKAAAAVVCLLDGEHPGGRYVRASMLAREMLSKDRYEHEQAAECRAASRLVVVEMGRESPEWTRPALDSMLTERISRGRLTVVTVSSEAVPRWSAFARLYPELASIPPRERRTVRT